MVILLALFLATVTVVVTVALVVEWLKIREIRLRKRDHLQALVQISKMRSQSRGTPFDPARQKRRPRR